MNADTLRAMLAALAFSVIALPAMAQEPPGFGTIRNRRVVSPGETSERTVVVEGYSARQVAREMLYRLEAEGGPILVLLESADQELAGEVVTTMTPEEAGTRRPPMGMVGVPIKHTMRFEAAGASVEELARRIPAETGLEVRLHAAYVSIADAGVLDDPEWALNKPLPEEWLAPGREVRLGEAMEYLEKECRMRGRSARRTVNALGGPDTVLWTVPASGAAEDATTPRTARDAFAAIQLRGLEAAGTRGAYQAVIGADPGAPDMWSPMLVHRIIRPDGQAAPE